MTVGFYRKFDCLTQNATKLKFGSEFFLISLTCLVGVLLMLLQLLIVRRSKFAENTHLLCKGSITV